jgi:hypothetical protein
MTALVLLACHLVGDFIFQTRWQSAHKLDDWRYRARHVATYALAFLPVVFIADNAYNLPLFFFGLVALHFLTDSRRFYSTLGDVLVWPTFPVEERRRQWMETKGMHIGKTMEDMPPNPWPPLFIVIDQTLHIAQLAILGWLLV